MKSGTKIITGFVLCTFVLIVIHLVAKSPLVPPLIRVAIGLLMVTIPGISITTYLYPKHPSNILHYIGYGFSISLVLIGIIGLLMRTLGWTMNEVRLIWQVLICAGLMVLVFKIDDIPRDKVFTLSTISVVNLVGIVCLTLFFIYMSIYNTATKGDTGTYNVEVTNFLRSTPMDWEENYYDSGNNLSDRLAFSYWTLAQAIVVDLSDVHIIEAKFFINGLLMILVVAASYIFCRNLGCAHNTALLVTLVQFILFVFLLDDFDFALSRLLNRLFYDKTVASFIIAPILVSTFYQALHTRSTSHYILALLLVWSVIFAHPMVMGFIMVTLVGWLGLELILNSEVRRWALTAIILLCIVFSPVIFVRLTTDTSDIYDYGEEVAADRIAYISFDEETGLYALHPNLVGNITYAVVILATVFAVLGRLGTPEYRLMLAYAVTIGIGLIPYTAWIYGNLVSIQHMNRVVWLTPYGYIIFFVLKHLWHWAQQYKLPVSKLSSSMRVILVGTILIWMSGLGFMVWRITFLEEITLPYDYEAVVTDLSHIIPVASYISENHDERVMVIGDPVLRNHILSLTYRAKTLSHYHSLRMKAFSRISIEQSQQQVDDNLRLFEDSVTPEEQLSIIDRYDVRYLLYENTYETVVNPLLIEYPDRFELVMTLENVLFVKVISSS